MQARAAGARSSPWRRPGTAALLAARAPEPAPPSVAHPVKRRLYDLRLDKSFVELIMYSSIILRCVRRRESKAGLHCHAGNILSSKGNKGKAVIKHVIATLFTPTTSLLLYLSTFLQTRIASVYTSQWSCHRSGPDLLLHSTPTPGFPKATGSEQVWR